MIWRYLRSGVIVEAELARDGVPILARKIYFVKRRGVLHKFREEKWQNPKAESRGDDGLRFDLLVREFLKGVEE